MKIEKEKQSDSGASMKTMYKVCLGKIGAVKVEIETDKTVVLAGGERCHKRSSYYNFFNKWSEAHEFLVSECREKVSVNAVILEKARDELKRVESMKEPA